MSDAGAQTRLRLATAVDVPALFAIRTSVRENHLDLQELAVRGVTPESVLASFTRERACSWEATIFALFVHPEGEGRGYGRALLREAEEWLFEAGCETIWLETGAESHFRAHGFYRAAGWALVGPADHGDVRYEKRRST